MTFVAGKSLAFVKVYVAALSLFASRDEVDVTRTSRFGTSYIGSTCVALLSPGVQSASPDSTLAVIVTGGALRVGITSKYAAELSPPYSRMEQRYVDESTASQFGSDPSTTSGSGSVTTSVALSTCCAA